MGSLPVSPSLLRPARLIRPILNFHEVAAGSPVSHLTFSYDLHTEIAPRITLPPCSFSVRDFHPTNQRRSFAAPFSARRCSLSARRGIRTPSGHLKRPSLCKWDDQPVGSPGHTDPQAGIGADIQRVPPRMTAHSEHRLG
jgi:hypothetical protein